MGGRQLTGHFQQLCPSPGLSQGCHLPCKEDTVGPTRDTCYQLQVATCGCLQVPEETHEVSSLPKEQRGGMVGTPWAGWELGVWHKGDKCDVQDVHQILKLKGARAPQRRL